MADNFHFDLTGVSLDLCLKVAFQGRASKAVGWMDTPACTPYAEDEKRNAKGPRLVLFWTKPTSRAEGYVPFPAPMDAEQVEPMIKAWLAEADYGHQPDHDGDNGRGHRVYNESWTHAGSYSEAFVAIQPAWLMYGK